MKKYLFLLVGCLLAVCTAQAETVVIKGKAPDYKGKKIALYVYGDYISLRLIKKAEAPLLGEKGEFSLETDISEITEAILKIDGVQSFLYLEPGNTYQVTFPAIPEKQAISLSQNQVPILFDTLAPYDINSLILDFDDRLDAFIGKYYPILGSPVFKMELDSFRTRIGQLYQSIQKPFFRDYVYYSFASVEQIGGVKTDMLKLKALLYTVYLAPEKVRYHHGKYMLFFNEFYHDILKLASTEDEKILNQAINRRASASEVMRLLESDKFLKNERIREMVMIKALSQEYHSGNYHPTQIIAVLDSVKQYSNYPENRLIADNMIHVLTRMGVGYEAPGFALEDIHGNTVALSDFQGKYIYLQFWATWNNTSLSEMKLMTELHKKYGNYIAFVSINVDDDPAELKKYLKARPEIKWTQLHYSAQPEVLDLYRVKTVSLYYFIGPEGKILQSPAYRPTPNGTFVSIEKTLYEIARRNDPNRNRPKEGKNIY